jgi:hypothetical protein
MATTLKNAQQLAAITAKEERARDAALAMREYEANKLAVRTNTARLRALRLAKEAENRQYTNTKKAVKEDRNLFKAWRNKRSSAT